MKPSRYIVSTDRILGLIYETEKGRLALLFENEISLEDTIEIRDITNKKYDEIDLIEILEERLLKD